MANWDQNAEGAAEEGFSFEDSDRFDEESMCSWMSEPESVCTNWRGWRKQNNSLVLTGANQNEVGQVTRLMELCAQAVASNIPFEQVEETFSPVPENVQLRIAYWSFPDNEEDIRLYSCLANGSPDEFQRGEYLVRARCVRNVLQIGFHLCANVTPHSNSINKSTCSVAVTFDRCRITSCSCNCGSTAKWCAHVVALCLVRIQQPGSVTLRAPVSESLSRLRREQLQKFAQYLISELPQQILPTAQRLLDELLSSCSTEINKLKGAPDPTAGPSMCDRSLWYLDESALNDNIKKTLNKFCGPSPIVYSDVNSLYLSSTEPPAAAEYSSLLRPLRGREPEGIWNLLSIVREMLKRRDSNAVPLLDIVTEQCLFFEQVAVWWYNTRTSSAYLQSGSGGHSNHRPSNNNISSEIAQHAAASMCDEIVTLWKLVILDPSSNRGGRKEDLKSRLQYFHDKTLEIIKRGKYKESHLQIFAGFRPAIDACGFDWEATEIVKCSHIASKTRQTNQLYSCCRAHNGPRGSKPGENHELGACFYESPAGGARAASRPTAKKLRPPAAHRMAMSRKQNEAESASDDSCIERDIENLHLEARRWEVAESPLDFTSDDGSSVCSPVQFTLSSSDDNDHTRANSTVLASHMEIGSPSGLPPRSSQKSSANESSGTEVPVTGPFSALEDAESSKYRSELDSLFTRAESLYTHGRLREACELSVKLAEEFLSHPEELIKEPEALQGNRRQWIKVSTSYACKCLERALFLCTVLSEQTKHHTLAFRVGLQGLELKRLPASSKALEVKLFYQQGELAALMKRIPIGQREIARLREKAHALASVDPQQEFEHVLPLMLTTFIFDAFCQPPPPSGRNVPQRREVDPCNQDIGFAAAVNALGFKVNVSEAEHPLLCEGTRKQKGELAMQMLLLYKDQQHKLRMILENFLDKSLSANLRASSAFPSYSSTPSRRPTSSSASSQQVASASHRRSNQDHPPVGGAPSEHDLGHAVADESTDEDDVRPDDRPFGNLDHSLPGPHGDMKSSCDDEYPSTASVCSPPRRDSKLSWRSPTVRPKRKQHCITNVNSSASEEAMLSDTSPRSRRRNLSGHAGSASNAVNLSSLGSAQGQSGAAWGLQRYPSSPSSDSGSSSSADSIGTSSGDNKRLNEAARPPLATRSPPRPNTQPHHVGGASKPAYASYRKSRGRNSVTVPDLPNQPSEAAAHFFFEVAKNVLVKAGGNSSTSLFMQQPQGNNQSGVHRNLALAAFEIGLYALGLHNCVSPNWLSRTYSSHVSWITGQAMDIGSAALQILVDSWEGHLTPPETASLADRASRGRDGTTVRRASELALSVLPHASAINPNEISRALLQCKEQGATMLEKACCAVEQAGRGGGVYPEVLFEVAKQWEWIHEKVNSSSEKRSSPKPAASSAPVVSASASAQPSVSISAASLVSSSGVVACLPTITPAVSTQSLPVSVSGMMLPGGVITIQDPRLPPIQCHPAPILHGFAPTMLDPQISGFTPGISPMQYAAAVQLHPAPTLNLVPMPASNLHALQYHASRAPFLPDPHHHHPSTLHHQSAPPIPTLPTFNIQAAAPISTQLQSAFRVGMLALDLLTKRTEDRPNNKYARNPPYANDVKWILKLSMKLGMHYVQQFCMAAVGGVSSPFVLQDIAVETAKYLSETNNQQLCANLRAPFLLPIVSKCLTMYAHFIHNRLYHLHHTSDHDEFVNLVHTARNAFCMTPNGMLQFNDVLQSIHRSKACKKDLWQKINTGLSV